jgi:hypothetical protein
MDVGLLTQIAWVLTLPVLVLLAVVLTQVVFLLHTALDFLNLLRYEVAPTLRELRLTATHVEELSQKTVSGVRQLEPAVGKSVAVVRHGVGSLVEGIMQSFKAQGGNPR